MKYLKRFKNESDYQAFKGGGDFITPNVSFIDETNGIKFEPHVPVSPYEPVYLQLILGDSSEYVDDGISYKNYYLTTNEKDETSISKLFNFYKSLIVISEEHKKNVEENDGLGTYWYDIDITAFPFYVNGIKIDSIGCRVSIENYDYEHPAILYFSFYTDQLLTELCLQLGLDLNSELFIDTFFDVYFNANKISVDLVYNSLVSEYVGVGYVAYWDGSIVKTTHLNKYITSSLGTAIGVVVVPEGFAPDGKVRIIGLKPVDKNGNQSSSHVSMTWGSRGVNTSLTNYEKVPVTDNAGSTSSGSYDDGYLPSDNFTRATSFVDPKAKYDGGNPYIPSPYLGDSPNPEYYKAVSGNNVLSDFNGLSNTETLVGLGSDYEAANAAWKYNDGASNLQWYLPGMGELGYVMPRFNEINDVITTLGGVAVDEDNYFCSSTESGSNTVYILNSGDGKVDYLYKDRGFYVYPFAILD